MCGICGIVSIGRPAEARPAQRMASAMAHRGPDGQGLFAGEGVVLAARRLGVIDLGEMGDQPLGSHDGRLQVVHNGEIYNHRELGARLPGSLIRSCKLSTNPGAENLAAFRPSTGGSARKLHTSLGVRAKQIC